MQLIDNAGRTALTSYSLWAGRFGILCLLIPDFVYWQWGVDTNPRVWWFMALALLISGELGRYVLQPGSSWPMRFLKMAVVIAVLVFWGAQAFAMGDRPQTPKPVTAASGLASDADFLDVGVPYVGAAEGKRLEAYLDRIASPPVWTVCYGETKGVTKGMKFSDRQCDDMLARELISYRSKLHVAFTEPTKAKRLPVQRDVAYTSLAYNAGVYAISRSTAVRRLNDGDIVGGCEAIGWWNKAGGRVIRGLVNRRAKDIAMCMFGVQQ